MRLLRYARNNMTVGGDCFAMLAMTRPLENGKMNGYRIKSGMTKGKIKKGSGEPLWKQFNLLWLGG